jgi:hypothetical protein
MFERDNRRGIDALDRVFWVSDHDYILYHQERPVETQLIRPSNFLFYTDDELKDLTRTLLTNRIPPTPSQVGLHPTDRQIESMWKALKRDEERIKTIGLKLTNKETGEEQTWYDKTYDVGSKQNFIWSLVEHQLGYAGFVMNELDARNLVSTLQNKMPPETKLTIWKEVSPNVFAVGIENLSHHQEHTWNFINQLLQHYLHLQSLNQSMEIG